MSLCQTLILILRIREEKVIQYVQEKYGQYHVSGIVTFGHLLARAVARDVGRIIGFDEKTLNEISNLIPHQWYYTRRSLSK